MQTKGEYRVGTTFNPSNSGLVDQIKQSAAALIDLIEAIPQAYIHGEPCTDEQAYRDMEIKRLKALAQTETESAAMWAVKAATKPEKEE